VTGAAGLLLALVCIAIVALAVGMAAAVTGHPSTWLVRLLCSSALTIGAGLFTLAALRQLTQVLP
jgi:hypothetical protein